MGEHFALALQLRKYNTQPRKMRKAHKQVSVSVYGTTIFVLLVIMVLGYLVQVNSFSTKGYEIKALQKQVSELSSQQKKLEIEAANLQSLQRLESNQSTGMVPVTSVSYLQTTSVSQR